VSDSLSHQEIIFEYNTEHTVTVENGEIHLDGRGLLPIPSVRRKERQNIENLALAIALSIGHTTPERIRDVAMNFDGLEERCELFTNDGVDYVSSSIDTSPMRTKTTVEGLNRRVNIILGGRTKKLPLDVLREPLRKYAVKIAIYGEACEEFLDFIDSYPELQEIPHAHFPAFKEAIDYILDGISQGDTVLLSPAATSYGEFENYMERGRFFKDYVQKRSPKI
jgi:UDP-N-acetylmuramoylalanine--D-glutamate ligase